MDGNHATNTHMNTENEAAKIVNIATANVYHESPDRLEGYAEVKGYDFNKGLDY